VDRFGHRRTHDFAPFDGTYSRPPARQVAGRDPRQNCGGAAIRRADGRRHAIVCPAGSCRYNPPRLVAFHWAKTQAGKPYIYGGTGPNGYDCSGLVYAAYKRVGFTLPRTTQGMLTSGKFGRNGTTAAVGVSRRVGLSTGCGVSLRDAHALKDSSVSVSVQ
jgi:NlpC/P60 family